MTTKAKEYSVPRSLKQVVIGIDIIVLLLVSSLYAVTTASSGDESIALGLIIMVLFVFVSMPNMMLLVVLAFIKGLRSKGLAIYLTISVIAHAVLAFQLGFFDKTINHFKERQVQRVDPALYELRNAISLGPTSNMQKVRAALSAGANPNASLRDEYDLPLIVLAASRADYAVIQALLEFGAKPDVRAGMRVNDYDTPSAIELVLFADTDRDNTLRSLKVLRDAGASLDSELLNLGACHQGEQTLYKEFYSRTELNGAQAVLRTGRKGYTCLHYAIENKQAEFVRELLENKATQPGAKRMLVTANDHGQFPLDLALAQGELDIARLLLAHGAAMNQEKSNKIVIPEK